MFQDDPFAIARVDGAGAHRLSRRRLLRLTATAAFGPALLSVLAACSSPSTPAPAGSSGAPTPAAPAAAPSGPTPSGAASGPTPSGAASGPSPAASPATSASPAAAAAPPASGGEEIAVGAIVPLTGGGSPYGPNMQKAFELTVQEINKAGGPLGRQIKLYSTDGQTKPDAAVAAAQKLINVNHVVAILGTWSSAVSLAVIPIAVQNGIIEMNTSGAPEITSPKNQGLVFRTQPTDHPYGVAMARYAKDQGFAKVAQLVLNNPFALAVRDAFNAEWKQLGQAAVTESVVYNPGAASYAGELQKALAAGPDLVVLAGYTPDASVILKEAFSSGAKARFIGPGFAFNDDLVKNIGKEAAEGLIAVDGVPPVDKPGFKAFAATFKEATGADLADNFWPAQAHDQINILALAIEAAKSTKGADIAAKVRTIAAPAGEEVYDFASGVKLLREGKKINYQGSSGPCDFNEEGNIVSDFAVWVIQNGARKEVATFSADKLGSS